MTGSQKMDPKTTHSNNVRAVLVGSAAEATRQMLAYLKNHDAGKINPSTLLGEIVVRYFEKYFPAEKESLSGLFFDSKRFSKRLLQSASTPKDISDAIMKIQGALKNAEKRASDFLKKPDPSKARSGL